MIYPLLTAVLPLMVAKYLGHIYRMVIGGRREDRRSTIPDICSHFDAFL